MSTIDELGAWEELMTAQADFSTLDITSARTVTLDGARTIGKLIFADAANPDSDWTLGTGSSGPLTLAVSSGSPTVTVSNRTALISAVLAGSSGLTKAGAAPWCFPLA
jgi:hypothetical protein